jgi:hypothetical protein
MTFAPPSLGPLACQDIATDAPIQDAVRAYQIQRTIETSYPGLRKAPLLEQKRIGRKIIAEALGLVTAGARHGTQ